VPFPPTRAFSNETDGDMEKRWVTQVLKLLATHVKGQGSLELAAMNWGFTIQGRPSKQALADLKMRCPFTELRLLHGAGGVETGFIDILGRYVPYQAGGYTISPEESALLRSQSKM